MSSSGRGGRGVRCAARAAALWMLGAAATLALSCGGDSDRPAPPGTGPGASGAVQIRGGERLAWNQFASTLDDLRAHTFILFVDGNPAALSNAQCADVASAAGYDCAGRLPSIPVGTHRLELASVWNGQQSALSAPLTVLVVAAQQDPSVMAADLRTEAAGRNDRSALADGLGPISWLSAMPDGRLLFVESGTAVRIVAGDLVPEPAYAVERLHERIVGVAIDPEFDRTRAVYLAHSAPTRDGSPALSISRFRDVGNILGQRATIVADLPFAEDASAPLGIDGAGRLYAALPAPDATTTVPVFNGEAGVIVRFTRDGGVPRENPQLSPVVAIGFARPAALAIDAARGRVWLAGTHPSWDHSVAVLSTDPPKGSVWPQHPRAGLQRAADQSGFRASALSFTPPSTLNFASKDVVHHGTLDAEGAVAGFETFRLGSHGTVSSITVGLDGHLYVALLSADGRSSSIQQLKRR